KKVRNIIRSGYPTILYHRRLEKKENAHYIGCNEEQGVKLALEHLTGLGHRRIGFVSGPRRFSTGVERLKAFIEQGEQFQIEKGTYLIKEGGYDKKKTLEAVEELLRLPVRPTAIFAANDFMALQVLDLVLEKGLRVPEDISIMGFDDIPLAAHHSINLSTIDVQLHKGAIVAIEKLISLIDKAHPNNTPIQIMLDPQLKARESTGPPPFTAD
ncbi:MAG: LacI family DNA-binding transcriptional regulator, partial [Spirochaetota bacterium]